MSTSRASELINIVASIGVLAGLILVAYELRQNNEIAEAETFRTMWEMVGELQRLGVETDILEKVRIADEDPASLTDDDINRVDAYLALALEIQVVKAVMRESYGLYPVSVEDQALEIASYLLGGPFGRNWFAHNENWIAGYHPELASAIKHHLTQVPVYDGSEYRDALRNSKPEYVGTN